jgi:hypothetical protein
MYNFTCNLSFSDIQTRNVLIGWIMENVIIEDLSKSFQFDTTYEGYHTLNIILNLADEALRDAVFDHFCEYIAQNMSRVAYQSISKHICGLDSEPCSDLIVGGGVNE